MNDQSYSYLASPYTHAEPLIREARYHRAMEACFTLLNNGCAVYSPIVHFHEMAKIYGIAPNAQEFYQHGLVMLRASRGIYVLRLEGWGKSMGVKAEIQEAIRLGLPITYLSGDLNAEAAVTLNPDKPATPAA